MLSFFFRSKNAPYKWETVFDLNDENSGSISSKYIYQIHISNVMEKKHIKAHGKIWILRAILDQEMMSIHMMIRPNDCKERTQLWIKNILRQKYELLDKYGFCWP